jgi:hypothetical protein
MDEAQFPEALASWKQGAGTERRRGQFVTTDFPGLSAALTLQIGLETWTLALHWVIRSSANGVASTRWLPAGAGACSKSTRPCRGP